MISTEDRSVTGHGAFFVLGWYCALGHCVLCELTSRSEVFAEEAAKLGVPAAIVLSLAVVKVSQGLAGVFSGHVGHMPSRLGLV